jgi:hypothetical protein
MATRVLVTRAGTGASNNLIRSLKVGDPSLVVVGCHADRFVLRQSLADRNYLTPVFTATGFPAALRRIIDREGIDLVIPNSDPDVKLMSDLRGELPGRLYLPSPEVIDRCLDKLVLCDFLRARGLPAPATEAVTSLDMIEDVFARLTARAGDARAAVAAPRLWCRIRMGAGSVGAIPVKRPEQARAWIDYWEEMRGVPASLFTLSEYLPGRSFACQMLWHHGRLVLAKTYERLAYFGAEGSPSGSSSIPALAKIVDEPRLVETSAAAIRALDPTASAAFDVDLKDDAGGLAHITEINAGRLISGTNLFDLAGKRNMASTYVRLALGEPVSMDDPYEVPADYYMVRDLDTVPGVFHADEFFEGIEEAGA